LFKQGKITEEQATELKQILNNEKYMAIEDGDIQALYTITSWLSAVDTFLTKKVNIFEDVKVSDSVAAKKIPKS
jgi:hypothetical protein